MDVPRVEGLKPGDLLGRGGCGKVFHAKDAADEDCAIKVFDEATISRRSLEKMTLRLEAGGWPVGVLRVFSADFYGQQPFWITPLVAEMGGEVPVPRTLQRTLAEHPGEGSWPLVRSLARALMRMHQRHVPHGNLKPSNVFLTEDGEPLLSDWTMGNMPGTSRFHFTDAVLYQPPEQLRNPAEYLEEAGYRWDVFAFGVLSYRILTGRFPRCHETFDFVAPPPAEDCKQGINADLAKIARNLEAQPEVVWPDTAQTPMEAEFRRWIDRCLPLDPLERPLTMIEVVAGFDALENRANADVERDALLDQRRRADRRTWRTLFVTGAVAAGAAVLGGLWQITNNQLLAERADHRAETSELNTALEAAVSKKSTAEKTMADAQQALAYERDLAVARLEASRLIADRLFGWAMEKGNRRLPPLDGRELRLKRLETYFEDFLNRTVDVPSLADERARVRLQLAEVSLAAGDAKTANRRLGETLDAWGNLPMDAQLKLRVATDTLLLALLRQSNADPETEASFAAARKALGDVPQSDVDADRLNQLLAVLDFHEAKIFAAKGNDTKALEQLLRATQTLNRIADQRPDAAILRSELAGCYLSSATILDGMGKLGDAREVRALASVELVKLLKENPKDFSLRLDLAGCYNAMAESAVLSGDIAGAEGISKEALKLLDELVVEQPENVEAVSRKAAQLGLRAGIKRDKGFAADAMKDYDEGIRMLEAMHVSAPTNAMVSFRLSLLWWQKGRMLGLDGQHDPEIGFLKKARALLLHLEASPATGGPRPEQLQSSGAYLLGDLGHALQLANQRDAAKRAFGDAVHLWEALVQSRPQSEEYTEGLAWCRQRLADLK